MRHLQCVILMSPLQGFCVVGEEFIAELIENPSEKLTLTRSGDLRNFRARPVGGADLALPAPL